MSQKERDVKIAYFYACREYPGMEECPGLFHAETVDEIWRLIELHATIAHGEDPSAWTTEGKPLLKGLLKTG